MTKEPAVEQQKSDDLKSPFPFCEMCGTWHAVGSACYESAHEVDIVRLTTRIAALEEVARLARCHAKWSMTVHGMTEGSVELLRAASSVLDSAPSAEPPHDR